MIQRDDMGWEVGGVSGLVTHVHPWLIHVNVWQNQYSIVKQNKVKIKIKKKESACNAGDPGSILGSGRSLGEGKGNPLQYSCLGNPTHRVVWQATVHGVAKSRTQVSD